MIQRKKQILASTLVIVFALYYANISFFYHSHIINGFTVSHSHFHTTEHSKAGTHSQNELSLLSILSSFQSLQVTLGFAGIGLFLLFITICRIGFEQKPVSVVTCSTYSRGPPALF